MNLNKKMSRKGLIMNQFNSNKQALDSIFQKGVLIDLNISFWHGRKALKPEDLGLDQSEVNEKLFSLGQKRHLPKDWIRKFSRIDTTARLLLADWAFRYGKSEAHFVPMNALPILMKKLEELQNEFFETAEEFKADYDKVKEEMIAAYEEEAHDIYNRLIKTEINEFQFVKRYMEKIEAFYPSSIADKYSFSWHFYEVTLPREFSTEEVDDIHKKLNEEEIKKQEAQKIINQYRNEAAKQAQEFMNTCVQKLRQATVEVCSKMKNFIGKDNKTITDSRLDKIKEFISKFRAMNFLDDYNVNLQLNELEKTLELGNAKEFNKNSDLGSQLQKALGKVVAATDEILAEDIVKRSLGFGRKVVKKSEEK